MRAREQTTPATHRESAVANPSRLPSASTRRAGTTTAATAAMRVRCSGLPGGRRRKPLRPVLRCAAAVRAAQPQGRAVILGQPVSDERGGFFGGPSILSRHAACQPRAGRPETRCPDLPHDLQLRPGPVAGQEDRLHSRRHRRGVPTPHSSRSALAVVLEGEGGVGVHAGRCPGNCFGILAAQAHRAVWPRRDAGCRRGRGERSGLPPARLCPTQPTPGIARPVARRPHRDVSGRVRAAQESRPAGACFRRHRGDGRATRTSGW